MNPNNKYRAAFFAVLNTAPDDDWFAHLIAQAWLAHENEQLVYS